MRENENAVMTPLYGDALWTAGTLLKAVTTKKKFYVYDLGRKTVGRQKCACGLKSQAVDVVSHCSLRSRVIQKNFLNYLKCLAADPNLRQCQFK